MTVSPGVIVDKINKIHKDGIITPDNMWGLVGSISKEIRKEQNLKWNHSVNIEFDWEKPKKFGEVYYLTITWTPKGKSKAREIKIPMENFKYKKQ